MLELVSSSAQTEKVKTKTQDDKKIENMLEEEATHQRQWHVFLLWQASPSDVCFIFPAQLL